jgi:hypothetical protein
MPNIYIGNKKYDYKQADFKLVAESEETDFKFADTPESKMLLEYIDHKISLKKPDQFKNYIQPLGEVSFLKKLVLTDVFDNFDITFMEKLSKIDDNFFPKTAIICHQIKANMLYKKLIYYATYFSNCQGDNIKLIDILSEQIRGEYASIKISEGDNKKTNTTLVNLSKEFTVKNIQEHSVDGKELIPLANKENVVKVDEKDPEVIKRKLEEKNEILKYL